MRFMLVSIAALLANVGVAPADSSKPIFAQKPALNKTHIVFGYAGDLWTVDRNGGEARRITTGTGFEFGPVFSPDGSQIAFTGEYDGNLDVFLMPAAGGEPRRLTFHPSVDIAVGWTPDGQSVLFSSGRTSYSRFNKLFTIPAAGGHPAELPLPMGEQGAFSRDGTRIAYVPFWNRRAVPNNYIAWKHYRGGLASPIWIADLADSRIEKIPREDSNDHCPMSFEGKVYFLSDRSGPTTLFSYDPQTKQVKQVLENKGYELLSASAGPDAIVYEQFGSLHTFDPKTGSAKAVPVTVATDFGGTRTRYEKVAKKITDAGISPTGARAVFAARGDILTVPAEKGDVRNLTQSTAAVERSPAWSPDGKLIAYLSDESGEYMLHLRDAKATGETKKITLGDSPSFYQNLVWSPDNKKIAYTDKRMQQWYVDLASGKSTKVDQHTFFSGPFFDSAWSPDSRWIAYTKVLGNKLRAVFLYDTTTNKSHQVTDGMSDARHTVFDKGGKYLYFTASTDIGPTTTMIDMSGMNRPVTRSVYLVVLDKSVPSPLAPESDEEKDKADAAKDAPKPGAKPAASSDDSKADEPKNKDKEKEKTDSGDKTKEQPKAKDAVTKIDLEDLGQRILALPLPARNYVGLDVGKAGSLFLAEVPVLPMAMPPSATPGQIPGILSIQRFDLTSRKPSRVLDGISSFDLSADGEKMLYRQGEKWLIASVPPAPPSGSGAGAQMAAMMAKAAEASGAGGNALKTDDMEVQIDPRAEWKQMYREVWRLQRDFLYDPNYHGLDIAAAEKKYAPFLESVAHRADLNYLFNEMLGNLVLGHTYVGGGDTPEVKRVRGGLLGADYRIENGRYRFGRIYNGENWNPQLRAPLTQPGVNVKEGEYLLAVNGKDLKATDSIYAAFEATAGKAITIKVGPTPDGKDARDVTVVPVDSETGLRNLAWVEGNRRKVDELSKGKVAYVYLPDTGMGGFTNFNRYFFAQTDKQGVVLDERFNGGGYAADYIIEHLRRQPLNYWTSREGKDYSTPGGAIFGPKAMIINEFAGSGGDAMPWYFKRTNCGPLVGKRTWGGLVGISGYPPLLDGGFVTAPSFAFYTPDGTWDVENRGVPPTLEVEHDPFEVRNGRDPQLEKAVEHVLDELKKNPVATPKKPAYPDYHGKGNQIGKKNQ
jgi:tricorn protease